MPKEEKNRLSHRFKAMTQFKQYLNQNFRYGGSTATLHPHSVPADESQSQSQTDGAHSHHHLTGSSEFGSKGDENNKDKDKETNLS